MQRIASGPGLMISSTRRQGLSRIGRTRSTSQGCPPARPSSCPARAGPVVPSTGHSTEAPPRPHHGLRYFLLRRRRHGAHFNECLAISSADEAVRPFIDGADGRGIEQARNHDVALLAQVARRRHDREAGGVRLGPRTAPDDDVLTRLMQPRCHCSSHLSRAGNTDAFSNLLVSLAEQILDGGDRWLAGRRPPGRSDALAT